MTGRDSQGCRVSFVFPFKPSPPYFPLVSVDPVPYLSEANSPAVVYLVLIWDNIYPKHIDLFCHEQNK